MLSSCSSVLEHVVVYAQRALPVTAGKVYRHRRIIHGCPIPASHVCVLVTKTHTDVAVPLVLGDPSENCHLQEGQFFALPIKHLKTVRFINGSLDLTPFLLTV